MTENSLQLQVEKQKKIHKILFALKVILLLIAIGDLVWAVLLLFMSSVTESNIIIFIILLFIASFLLFQWFISCHILNYSSVQFMQKNKILLFSYNILTLNILGIILANKLLKDDNYNCSRLMEMQYFDTFER